MLYEAKVVNAANSMRFVYAAGLSSMQCISFVSLEPSKNVQFQLKQRINHKQITSKRLAAVIYSDHLAFFFSRHFIFLSQELQLYRSVFFCAWRIFVCWSDAFFWTDVLMLKTFASKMLESQPANHSNYMQKFQICQTENHIIIGFETR